MAKKRKGALYRRKNDFPTTNWNQLKQLFQFAQLHENRSSNNHSRPNRCALGWVDLSFVVRRRRKNPLADENCHDSQCAKTELHNCCGSGDRFLQQQLRQRRRITIHSFIHWRMPAVTESGRSVCMCAPRAGQSTMRAQELTTRKNDDKQFNQFR